MEISGKVFIVTGAASGLGEGTARMLVANGAKVAVDVKKEGDGSQVSVTVGTLGDPKLGAELASEIKARAETR